ncbi:MAG TPA: PAS domain-containing protein, partial [Phycisphaerales bacterium]|nr:PAS domain-containing protein [Phycisphaerales bacterium]
MKAGKIASLILIFLHVVLCGAVWLFAPSFASLNALSPRLQQLALLGIVSLAVLAIFLPIGFVLDRTFAGLRKYMESAAVRSDVGSFVGPKWVQPITRAFVGAIDQFRQREQGLRNQLGDLEIRHRVSEAERRQIEAVLHSLRDAVIVTNAFNEIVVVNQAAAEIFNFDRAKALHRPINAVIEDQELCKLIAETRQSAIFGDARRVEHAIHSGVPAP